VAADEPYGPRMVGDLKRILFVLVGAVALLASCSSDSDGGSEPSAAPAPAAEVPVLAAQTAAGRSRDLVQKATVVVSVDDAARAGDRATDLVEEAGGFLAAQESDLEGDAEVRITFKVPPERFRAVLDDLSALGRPLTRTSTTEDVTDRVVDLDGRLASARASAERLRALIADARTTGDIIAVEKELERREAEIESMQGQLRVLRDRVSLGTIEAHFTQKDELEVSGNLPGFLDGLRAGLVAFVTGGLLVLTLVGFALPFAPFALLGWWLWRRYRHRHPRPPRPAPPYPQWIYPGAPSPPTGGSGGV
jgi:Domain of unknown function (DUF4349)